MQSKVLTPELVRFVAGQFRLPLLSPHGPAHWMRVRRNGLTLAEKTGGNPVVVELFALYHDSCRFNEHTDPDHGPRGAILAEGCYEKGMINCSHDELELLQAACFGHTREKSHPNVTIATCWDADRLDLPRVGIIPVPHKLCTEYAKDEHLIELARLRAEIWVEKVFYKSIEI